MKKISTCYVIVVLTIFLFTSCSYTLYGAVMGEERSSSLNSQPLCKLYPADDYTGPYPKSIILIIFDGRGIGQYSTLYFGHDDFAPARLEHVGIVWTQPPDGNKKVADSAAGGKGGVT